MAHRRPGAAPFLAAVFFLAGAVAVLAQPALDVGMCVHGDSCALMGPGHADGEVEPGEDVRLAVFLANSGDADATNVTITVSTANPLVTVTQPNSMMGTVPVGGFVGGMPAVEYSVDPTFPCGDDIVFDIAIDSDQGPFMGGCQVTVPAVCDVCAAAPPDLAIAECIHGDACTIPGAGGGNGEVEPGEDVTLTIALQNLASGDATGILGTLTTPTPLVTITQDAGDFGDIPGFGIGNGNPPFLYTVDASFPCGDEIVFDLALATDQGDFMDSCRITVPMSCIVCEATPVDLQVLACAHGDGCALGGPGDADGNVDPGEQVDLSITLQNAGGTDATRVSVVVSTATPLVTVTQPNMDFGTIAAFSVGAGSPPAEYSVDESFPCGDDIVFDLAISSDQGDFMRDCSITVPVACEPCVVTPPDLRVQECLNADSCPLGGAGDADGRVDPGEDVELTVLARNDGGSDATGVTAVVSTATPMVTVTQPNVSFADVPAFGLLSSMDTASYTVDAAFPCGTDIVFDVAYSTDQGDFMDSCVVSVDAGCIPCVSGPIVRVADCSHADACALGGPGDADGRVDPGESAALTLTLENLGASDANNVTATVSTAEPLVAITQADAAFGAVPAGGMSAGAPTIDYTVDPALPCGTEIVFDVAISSDEGPFMDDCRLTIPVDCNVCVDGPALSVTACVHDDACPLGGAGDANGAVEPGESVSLTVTLGNGGLQAANNVNAIASSPTPGVTITQDAASFGNLAPAASADGVPPIEYTVDEAVPCGAELVFEFMVTSDEGDFMSSCRTTIPMACEVCAAAGDPPEEVPWLITRCLGTGELEIEWMPAPGADTHDVHQGTLAGLTLVPMIGWDHECVLKDQVAPFQAVVPGTTCGDDLDAYFLIVGRNAAGYGTYGVIDSDHDGVPDLERDPGPVCP